MLFVSQGPLEKLQAYKRRMGWSFPWVSSANSEFNVDLGFSNSEEQTRAWVEPEFLMGYYGNPRPGAKRPLRGRWVPTLDPPARRVLGKAVALTTGTEMGSTPHGFVWSTNGSRIESWRERSHSLISPGVPSS
jgi:hypothetical protein